MLYFCFHIILYLMRSFILGGSFKSTDHKSASQLDSYRLRAFYHVLSAERLVRMATRVYQSAYRVHNRARGDKRKDGKWSGRQNGRYTYLAAWHVFFEENYENLEQTRKLMKKFLRNVLVFDTGGRAATTTFVDRNQGDVLINFESESKLIQNQYSSDNYEIIIPNPNILVEFPVTWIDKNVFKHGTKNVAQAYLNYLYTFEAQQIIRKFGYRINITDITKMDHNELFGIRLFRAEDQYSGSWDVIMNIHFSRGGELDQFLLSIGRDN